MFWKKQMMSKSGALIAALFLIGALHTLIFGIFQYPSLIMGTAYKYLGLYAKIVMYVSAVGAAFLYQTTCRIFGLKGVLMGGLFSNLLGLLFLWLNQSMGGQVILLFLDMFFCGVALSPVISALITFTVLKFPKRTGTSITALFIALNGGIMFSHLLLGLFKQLGVEDAIFPFLMILTVISIWFVKRKMYNPPYPVHLRHLRKDTLIWKELHYRLGLYFLATIAYGAVETTFSLWGLTTLNKTLDAVVALETIPIFYLFLIIGQILLLLPLYFYSPAKIFYGLVLLCGISLYLFFYQKFLFGFITVLAMGGISCSAMFPIIISMMEKELISVAGGRNILPYIETGVSILIAGYLIGNAFNDLWIGLLDERSNTPYFHMGIGLGFVGMIGLIALGLNLTAPKKL